MSFEVWRTSSLRRRSSRDQVSVGEPTEGPFTHFNVMFVHSTVVAMYMTFRRRRAWPTVGGGFVDCGQQSSLVTLFTIIFTTSTFSIFVDGFQLYEQHNVQ